MLPGARPVRPSVWIVPASEPSAARAVSFRSVTASPASSVMLDADPNRRYCVDRGMDWTWSPRAGRFPRRGWRELTERCRRRSRHRIRRSRWCPVRSVRITPKPVVESRRADRSRVPTEASSVLEFSVDAALVSAGSRYERCGVEAGGVVVVLGREVSLNRAVWD